MAPFKSHMEQLVAQLDAEKHADEIQRLRGFRSLRDLDNHVQLAGGWLTDEGQKAISEMDGTELDGRRLRVNEARPQGDRDGGGRRY